MKRIICAFGLLCVIGCQNIRQPERPDNLITEEKMIDIFYDAYMANAAKSINNKKLRQFGIRLDSVIYEKHDIDSIQFARSNEYYSLDLDNYSSIFAKVEARLLDDQKEYDSIKEALRSDNKSVKARVESEQRSRSKSPVAKDSSMLPQIKSLIPSIQSSVEVDSLK
jgi:hypothetical protein